MGDDRSGAVPKDPSCANVSNNRPISITPILSKVFEKLLAKRLITYFETNGYLPKCQFAYRKGLSTCDALLSITHELQKALDNRSEFRLVKLDFSAAFDLLIMMEYCTSCKIEVLVGLCYQSSNNSFEIGVSVLRLMVLTVTMLM